MKKSYFLILMFAAFNCSSQQISEIEKYKEIGLVWGLAKYHHPDVSRGIYDWNTTFIDWCEKSQNISGRQALEAFLLSGLKKLDSSGSKYKTSDDRLKNEKIFLKNVDYAWIENVSDPELKTALLKLRNNSNIGDFYAHVNTFNQLELKNEKEYDGFDFKNKFHRLLLLYSFWNVIQYWDVNKFLTDTKWSELPDLLTDVFLNADSPHKFGVAKTGLLNKLCDSHAFGFPDLSETYKYPSFRTTLVNDTLEVDRIMNQQAVKKDGIVLGDRIVSIGNISVEKYTADSIAPYFSSSNGYYKRFADDWFILSSRNDSLSVGVLSKDNQLQHKVIHLLNTSIKDNPSQLESKTDSRDFYLPEPGIGYINLAHITKKDMGKAFKSMSATKGIVIDLRNYPEFVSDQDMAKYLYPERKLFLKVLYPIQEMPSYGEYDAKTALSPVIDPFKAGSKNKDYYKGRIILLVNSRTVSKAEFIGMAIQQAPDCFTIGKPTAGAVMNVIPYVFPDGTKTIFTGGTVHYPDGTIVQRNGLKIDQYVRDNYMLEDDSYIAAAIKWLHK